MKRIYVKPLTEELEGQGFVLLAGSPTSASINGNKVDNISNPIPQNSREFGDDFVEEDDEY